MQNLKNIEINDGMTAAKVFKYYSQFISQDLLYPMPIEKIGYIVFYKKNKKKFDNLVFIFNKNNINILEYIKFLILQLKVKIFNVNENLLNITNIQKYIEYCAIKKQRENIYNYIIKSIENIANDCIHLNFLKTIDYIKYLILNKKLVQYYISGKISKYYLSAISKFPDLVKKMDNISKDEFQSLVNKFDKYNNDAKEAMIFKTKKVFSVIQQTDNKIKEKQLIINF